MDIEKLSAEAIILQLDSALVVAKEYIAWQDKKIKELQAVKSIGQNNSTSLGLITADKAAELLGVKSKNTIYELMNQHILPEIKIRSRRMIHIDDINQYILNQRRKAI